MPPTNREYSYGAGSKVSRRTLYRRRLAEGRRVERLSVTQWRDTLDRVIMEMDHSASSNSTTNSFEAQLDHDHHQQRLQPIGGPTSVLSSNEDACDPVWDTVVEGRTTDDNSPEGQRTDDEDCLGGHRTEDDLLSPSETHPDPSFSLDETDSSTHGPQQFHEENNEPSFMDNVDDSSINDGDATLLQRLCGCTDTTVGEVVTMVMSLGVRHSITWTGMVDILRLINVLFARRVVPDTKHLFLKHVDPSARYKLERHVYCAHCHHYFGKRNEGDDHVECPCRPDKKLSYFMTIGLKQQLEELLKKEDIKKALKYGFDARKHGRRGFSDVFDGEVYKGMCQPGGLLFNNHNLSFSFNTDGVAFGKSSNRSVWPIYVSLNELPPRLRFKHMLLAGVWVGPGDPNMFAFLRPFVEDCNKLSEEGVTWALNGNIVSSKVVPMCLCVDSPARCKVLNMKQFHGLDSCGFCYHRGNRVAGVIGFRYSTAGDVPALRTDADLRRDMMEAHNRIQQDVPICRQVVRGVQGPSALMALNNFNLATMVVPDLMHLFKLVQSMLCIYQDTGRNPHLDVDKISLVSSRFVSFKPPSCISRSPRPLSDLKLFKCNELRNFLLLYGVVSLKGILCDKYVAHFSLLSSAVRLLTNKTVTNDDVNNANNLLSRFVVLHEQYFGLKAMTINVHLLLHLPKAVLDHGPLWASNCFPYEGENRNLVNLLQSPAAVAQQITRKFICKSNASILCDRYNVSEEVRRYCESLGARRLKHFRRSEKCLLPGSGHQMFLCQEEQAALTQFGFEEVQSVLCYDKVIYNNMRLTTCVYSDGLKLDDSVVVLCNDIKGQIIKICYIEAEETVVLLVTPYVEDRNPVHIHEDISYGDVSRVIAHGVLRAVKLEDVIGQCLVMDVEHVKYVMPIPFGCYGD